MAKHNYDKTLTRLTTILSRLNEGEELTVAEMANDFNVTTRTILRDVKLLSRFATYGLEKSNKKWRMKQGFKLQKKKTIEDSIVLDILSTMAKGVGVKFNVRAKKLLSKLQNKDFSPLYTKLNIEDMTDYIKEIELLEIAIKEKTCITCKYNDIDYKNELTLKPLRVVNFEGYWYLLALDARNNKMKKYYFKSLSSIKLQKNTFKTSFSFENKLDTLLEESVSLWFNMEEEPLKVTINIAKEVAKYFKRRPISKTQVIASTYGDGSMDVIVKITEEMEIKPLIKYWIPYLQVIEPVWIQEMIDEELQSYISQRKKISSY